MCSVSGKSKIKLQLQSMLLSLYSPVICPTIKNKLGFLFFINYPKVKFKITINTYLSGIRHGMTHFL